MRRWGERYERLEVQCGVCGGPGVLVLDWWDGTVKPELPCSCRQRWAEEGRSPLYGSWRVAPEGATTVELER